MIIGTNRYDLNGRVGAATSFDHARGRYTVESDAGADESDPNETLPTQTSRALQDSARGSLGSFVVALHAAC